MQTRLNSVLTFQRMMMNSQAQNQCGYSSYGRYLYGGFLSVLTFVVGAIILFYVVSQSVVSSESSPSLVVDVLQLTL